MNLADGKPNEWQCRAGARYLYICENGLVHWCSQQRGTPGVPLASYSVDDIRREFLAPKWCAPLCTIGCVHRVSTMDYWRKPQKQDPERGRRARSASLRSRGRRHGARPSSFDITSGVDLQEVDNAVNQARKEVAQRYDFKGSRAAIDLNRAENTIVLTADDEFKMNALWEILQGRLVRRGVPTKNLTPGDIERAANDTVRRMVTLQQGIPTEAAREIVKFLKDRKLKKVQAAIQADQVRVSSASKDELQEAIRGASRARLRRGAPVRQLPRLSRAPTRGEDRQDHPARAGGTGGTA